MMNRPNDHLKISKNQQEMDENMNTTTPVLLMMTILRGIQLAKDLEPNLAHNLANQREYISRACDEIVRVFSSVREMIFPPPLQQLAGVLDHSWLRTAAHDHQVPDHHQVFHPHMVAPPPLPAQPAARIQRSWSGGGGEQTHHQAAAQRPRRLSRRNELDRHTKIVPAPQMGNVDIPPEDGYTWRKYGQKEILGSRFPRAYYRCTHQKLYSCPAKKQVQRLDDNPFMFQVTYRSNHICHMSTTAPSSAPPPLHPPTATSSGGAVTGNWLTMDIKPQPGEAAGTSSGLFGGHAVSVSSTSDVPVAAGSGTAGPSTARYDREVVGGGDYGGQPVVDFADVMFNYSGSSSNNSMDLIFPSSDHKGDISGEKI